MRRQIVAAAFGHAPPFGPRAVGGVALLRFQRADDVDHVARVQVVARQVLGAEFVGLRFLLAAVGRDITGGHALRDLAGQAGSAADAEAFERHAEQGRRKHPQASTLFAGRALRAVACGDMADLVPQDPGQIGFVVERGQHAAGDVDVAAGQRKSIHLGAVEHREGPLQQGAVRALRQALADIVDIGLQARVVERAVFGHHLRVGLLAFGHLGRFVHHAALAAPADRVDDRRAAAGEQHRGNQDLKDGAGGGGHGRLSLWSRSR